MTKPFQRIMQAEDLLEKAKRREQQLRIKSRQRSLHGKSIRTRALNTILKKSGKKWGFGSEKALEDFVWDNLDCLFGLTPLNRQHTVNGEVCDILAVDESKQLVVQELKNEADKSLIQQLTRYYSNLIQFKPYDREIDYIKPIRLVAIAPSFHKQNLIDIKYSQLSFELLKFDVVQEENKLFINFNNIDTGQVFSAEFQHSQQDVWDIAANLPEPPKALYNIMAECTSEHQGKVLKMREQILCFHEKIQEITASGVVKYGRGQSKICAEIRHSSSSKMNLANSSNDPGIYLYLPIPDKQSVSYRQPLGRMQVLADELQNVILAGYIPPGKRGVSSFYKFQDFEKFINPATVTNKSTQLEILIDLALENWLERF
ncbi:endonuclease NucS [Microcoleus sp. MON1_C5]|uniref:endonuclease NucS domain-containing protein n=1 Tax=Microcoleus sp. MON1_C5 TaxID=2818828 RepID=UPI002FD1269F